MPNMRASKKSLKRTRQHVSFHACGNLGLLVGIAAVLLFCLLPLSTAHCSTPEQSNGTSAPDFPHEWWVRYVWFFAAFAGAIAYSLALFKIRTLVGDAHRRANRPLLIFIGGDVVVVVIHGILQNILKSYNPMFWLMPGANDACSITGFVVQIVFLATMGFYLLALGGTDDALVLLQALHDKEPPPPSILKLVFFAIFVLGSIPMFLFRFGLFGQP